MSDFITESEQYSYPLPVTIAWTGRDFQSSLWKYYYLLEPPTGNFIHLKFRSSKELKTEAQDVFWVNSEAISTIAIASND